MFRQPGFILSALLAAIALVSTSVTAASAGSPPQEQSLGFFYEGEQLLQKNCQSCHELRPIHTSAKDENGWTQTIQRDIKEHGAKIPEEDMPVLVRYLTLVHGPVPDAPGKEILLNPCTMCHDLGRVKTSRRSPEDWEETLITMLNEGAPPSDPEFVTIHAYLSRYFGD